MLRDMERQRQRLEGELQRLQQAIARLLERQQEKLHGLQTRLENMNVERVLERGFVLVRGDDGALVTHANIAKTHETLELQFADGRVKTTPCG